jgi:hypothetical protein
LFYLLLVMVLLLLGYPLLEGEGMRRPLLNLLIIAAASMSQTPAALNLPMGTLSHGGVVRSRPQYLLT